MISCHWRIIPSLWLSSSAIFTGMSVRGEGHQLLARHLEAAVTGDRPGLDVGVAERRAHRRRDREAHRAQAARADVAVRPAELRVAGEPHLVLADVGDVGRVVVGELADPLDDVVRGQEAVAPGARAVPRAALGVAPPVGELGEVVRAGGGVDLVDEAGQARAGRASRRRRSAPRPRRSCRSRPGRCRRG